MEREKLIENMLTFFPVLHKKMIKRWPASGLSKLQFELLFTIIRHNGMPMSYYSDKMVISRPNLTGICDKLIEEGLIERLPDPDDRRIIILKATRKGREYILEHRQVIKREMMQMLDSLDDNDVIRLNELIDEIKSILKKVV